MHNLNSVTVCYDMLRYVTFRFGKDAKGVFDISKRTIGSRCVRLRLVRFRYDMLRSGSVRTPKAYLTYKETIWIQLC